jgi:hypothetical protein
MSFLDEQATGQIGIGEKANLSTLTRRKRKRKKGQAPTGSETYSLMPQDEFSNIVSSPTDIQQVGIGNLLQAQGSSAGEVPNVFKEYDSAAPLLGTKEAVYYQPPPDDDDDPGDDDDLPSVEDDPYIPDPGIPDFGSLEFGDINYQGTGEEVDDEGNPIAFNSTGKTFKEDLKDLKTNLVKITKGEIPDAAHAGRARDLGRELQNQEFQLSRPGKVDLTPSNQVVTPTDIDGNPIIDVGTGEAVSLDPADQSVSFDPSVSQGGGNPGDAGNVGMMASGGTVTKSKAKNKNSFMSMKGK